MDKSETGWELKEVPVFASLRPRQQHVWEVLVCVSNKKFLAHVHPQYPARFMKRVFLIVW